MFFFYQSFSLMSRPDRFIRSAFFMKNYNPNNYPSLLPQIGLTSDQIRSAVSDYSLVFSKEHNREVEWGMRLPMFVDAFYDFIIKKAKVPTQEESYQYYLEFNADFFRSLNRPDLMSGILARSYRTYPSLIRDVYFNKYIEEQLGTRCSVVYNIDLDVQEGIDLMLSTRRGNYAICFFTQTRRAYQGRAAKVFRHTNFDNVQYVEMPVEFQGSVKAGDFFLYGEKEYKELINLLTK